MNLYSDTKLGLNESIIRQCITKRVKKESVFRHKDGLDYIHIHIQTLRWLRMKLASDFKTLASDG